MSSHWLRRVVACLLMALPLAGTAQPYGVPVRWIQMDVRADSGHPEELSTILGPFNGQRASTRVRYIIRPPANFLPCYVSMNSVARSADAGYRIETITEQGEVTALRLIVGAWGEDFPSWAGHDIKLSVYIAAVQRQFMTQPSVSGTAPSVAVLSTSAGDNAKIACPLNAPRDGKADGWHDGTEEKVVGEWGWSWLSLDPQSPPGCPVFSWRLPPDHALPAGCRNSFVPIPAPLR